MEQYFLYISKVLLESIKKIYTSLDVKEEELCSLLEAPKDEKNGDIAFPVFSLSKKLSLNPNEIAESLKENIEENLDNNTVKEIIIKGAYINFFLNKERVYKDLLNDSKKEKGVYKKNNDKTVVVEFSSPNIAKPFHIGHIRSTVIGNAISNLYEYLGYKVIRINYLGDYGTQFGKMIVAFKKWGDINEIKKNPIKTLLGLYTKFHDESKKDPSLEEEARKAFNNLENKNKEELELWEEFREESINEFKRVYDILGVKFDYMSGESFYSEKLFNVVDELEEKKLLTESDGAYIVDLNKYDMTPALIKKSDGASLYITRDITAAIDRYKDFNFSKMLYIVASQQNLHFKQFFKIIELLGYDFYDKIFHIPFGLVSLEGKTLSSRKGDVVFLEDVLLRAIEKTKEIIKEKSSFKGDIDKLAKDVGVSAVIFNELSSLRIKDYVFSYDRVLNFDGDTGPYVQYTFVRLSSVINKSNFTDKEIIENALNLDTNVSDEAYTIIKEVLNFDEILNKAASENEPSIITRYVLDLAKLVNKFYQHNNILKNNEKEMKFNLSVIYFVRNVLKNGLDILGIKTPDEM